MFWLLLIEFKEFKVHWPSETHDIASNDSFCKKQKGYGKMLSVKLQEILLIKTLCADTGYIGNYMTTLVGIRCKLHDNHTVCDNRSEYLKEKQSI